MLCSGQDRVSKLLQTFYTLCGGQDGLFEFLHAFYTLCDCQDGFFELLQASNTLFGGQDELSELLQASYTLCVGQTESLSFYKYLVSRASRTFLHFRWEEREEGKSFPWPSALMHEVQI